MRRVVISAIIGVILGVGVFFVWRGAHLPPVEKRAEAPAFPTSEADLKIGHYFDLRGRTEVLISMQDNTFNPQVIIVDRGVKIYWKNEDAAVHFVDIPSYPKASKAMDKNDIFTLVFDKPGNYLYMDSAHPDTMKGLIIVK